MEDDSGIELSLGLSCGGSSGKVKSKESCSDLSGEGGRKRLIDGNLNISGPSGKHFVHSQIDKDDNNEPPRTDPATHQQENFWTDLGKCPAQKLDASVNAHGDVSQFMGFRESWLAGTGLNSLDKTSGKGEEKLDQHDVGEMLWAGLARKRKMPFEEMDAQKKQGKENQFTDAHENEDVAESESEGSTSRTSPSIARISYDASNQKDTLGFHDLSAVGSQGSVQQTLSAGTDCKVELVNLGYGSPFSSQSLPAVTVPYSVPSKVPGAAVDASGSGFPCIMQLMPSMNEGSSNQPINASHFQLAFGYSTAQIPALDPGSSVGGVSHPSQFSGFGNKCAGEGVASAEHAENEPRTPTGVLPHGLSETSAHEGKVTDLAKNAGKRPLPEIASLSSSSLAEDIMKGDKPKEAPEPLVLEGFLSEMPGIRPGIATAMKFGGNGSYPDLPWVSTTGPGPNGKTISGVPYRYGKKEIRIVCACHGIHMSPDEFVQHAAADTPNEESNNALPSFPSGSPAASAKS